MNPSFQGVNRLFVLSFEDRNIWQSYKKYFLPIEKITDQNILIDGRNLINQIKNDLRTYDNIRKTAIGQDDD